MKVLLVGNFDAGLLRRFGPGDDARRSTLRASTGEAAWEALATQPSPGLIVLDERMPVQLRRDFLEKLNGDPRWQSVPVLVASPQA